jgi:hypothetical protein
MMTIRHRKNFAATPLTLLLLVAQCGCNAQAENSARPSSAIQQPTASAATGPRCFQSSGAVLVEMRQRALAKDPAIMPAIEQLRSDAEAALPNGPYTVVNKKHPLPGIDPHDYVSLARYFWPNPAKPDGLPYIERDGQANPELEQYDARPFREMSADVYTLALAGYLLGERKFTDRSAYLLRTWFIDDATRMNPNLDHAQLVRGENAGRPAGIIESIRLLNTIDAVGLVQQTNGVWSDDDQAKMQAWFSDYARWMKQSPNGRGEAAATNNHGCWYDAQLATILLFLDRTNDARALLESVKTHRIDPQIEPSGEQPRELARTRAFSYSVYNLNALTLLADLGDRVGVDLWHYHSADRRSIRGALDWVIPYGTGKRPWTHQQIDRMDTEALLVPIRRAERAFQDPGYEAPAGKLKVDLRTDRSRLCFPAVETAKADYSGH